MLRLKALREEAGKTQAELAAIFKISRQVYANYENGINEPSLKMLVVIADYFQCSVDYLLGRSDDFGNVTVLADFSQERVLSNEEKLLLKNFRVLRTKEKQSLADYLTFLSKKD